MCLSETLKTNTLNRGWRVAMKLELHCQSYRRSLVRMIFHITLFIYMMINYFLSGHMIPLDWLGTFGEYVQYLPFKFLAYFPAAILLQKYTHAQLIQELSIELTWVLALLIANRIVFERGVRRYGAFGG